MTPILTPAYGRDYKSKKEATEAFLSGADFVMHSYQGITYANVNDLRADHAAVNIRYAKNRKVCVVRIPPAKAPERGESRTERDMRRLDSAGTVARIISRRKGK